MGGGRNDDDHVPHSLPWSDVRRTLRYYTFSSHCRGFLVRPLLIIYASMSDVEPCTRGPPVLLDMLLFVLTMIKFYRAIRDGWGRETIYSRFMQDGIWAFALPFGAYILRLARRCRSIDCFNFSNGYAKHLLHSFAIRTIFIYHIFVSTLQGVKDMLTYG